MILGALGFGHVITKQNEIQETAATIKEQTNGRIGQLMATVEQQRLDQQSSNEQHARTLRDMSDQHRRDMREMAEKLAVMSPIPVEPPVSGGGTYSSNL